MSTMRNLSILVLLGFLLFGCAGQGPSSQPQSGTPAQSSTGAQPNSVGSYPTSAGAQPGTNPGTPNAVKFSNSQYAPYAVQIAPGQLSDIANKALTGFTMNETPSSDGSLQVVITDTSTGQSTPAVVKPGYTLYFIETSYGDDPPGYDTSLGDDGLIMVDPNGYISQ